MYLRFFSERELRAVLSALRAVAAANDHFTQAERAFMESIGRVHGADVDADFVDPLTLDEVARRLTSPYSRKHALQLAEAMALVDGPPSGATRRPLNEMAARLGILERDVRIRGDSVAYAGAVLDDLRIPHKSALDTHALRDERRS
jgi:hypothetical protein